MCSTCKYLKDNDFKQGAGGGKSYYCSNKRCYVTFSKCENYEKSTRDSEKVKEIKTNIKDYSEIPDGLFLPLFIIIVVIILGLLVS